MSEGKVLSREELKEEINIKYNMCTSEEESITDALAQEKLEGVFMKLGQLDAMTDEVLNEYHEDIIYVMCHLEDEGVM